MKRLLYIAALTLAAPSAAQDAKQEAAPSPTEIVDAAPAGDWVAIDPKDLLVMNLAPDRDGNARHVIIQLISPPFSQGWVENIRKLAAAHWWDGTSIYRVQDNYVVQWGDATEAKPLPEDLKVVPESEYVAPVDRLELTDWADTANFSAAGLAKSPTSMTDSYAPLTTFINGWPMASSTEGKWPVHCYGMVGVARNLSPDTGTGAELYTVIGHAPRQLDRNIALVGRVIEGMENLSSLPRGQGELGFYGDDEADRRVPILSVRLGSELPEGDQPHFQYLSTDSASFAAYAEARANRRDPFFIVPAGGADICNIPVPIRRKQGG